MRLIDADALLEKVADLFPYCGHCDGYGFVQKECVEDIVKEAPTIEQPTWISCAERLPTENGKYLVIREHSVWKKSFRDTSIEFYSTEFEGWFFDGIKLLGVTHWMPLPLPPKEGEQHG